MFGDVRPGAPRGRVDMLLDWRFRPVFLGEAPRPFKNKDGEGQPGTVPCAPGRRAKASRPNSHRSDSGEGGRDAARGNPGGPQRSPRPMGTWTTSGARTRTGRFVGLGREQHPVRRGSRGPGRDVVNPTPLDVSKGRTGSSGPARDRGDRPRPTSTRGGLRATKGAPARSVESSTARFQGCQVGRTPPLTPIDIR